MIFSSSWCMIFSYRSSQKWRCVTICRTRHYKREDSSQSVISCGLNEQLLLIPDLSLLGSAVVNQKHQAFNGSVEEQCTRTILVPCPDRSEGKSMFPWLEIDWEVLTVSVLRFLLQSLLVSASRCHRKGVEETTVWSKAPGAEVWLLSVFSFRRSVFWKEPLCCCMDENCSCKITSAQSFGCKAHRRQWRDVSGGIREFWAGPLYVPVVISQLWAVPSSVVALLAQAVLACIFQWADFCSKGFVILEVSDL